MNGKPSRNVIADKRGRGPDGRGVVVVTAHLDSINLAGGAASAAPGADDNGSGAAGLLEMARVLAAHPGAHDLRFILFGERSRVCSAAGGTWVRSRPAKESASWLFSTWT